MAEKNAEPIILRQNLVFLISRVFLTQIVFSGIYILFDLPVMLLQDANPATTALELQADWYGLTLHFILGMVQMVVIIFIVLRWYNSYYEIRKDDIMEKHGLVTLSENTHSFRNFSAISISQSVFGRIFNFGTIKLFNPALEHKLIMKRVSSPASYMKILSERLPKTGENIIYKK